MRKLSIQHITYDESHEPISPSKERRPSAAQKARSFLSSHLSHHSDDVKKPLLSPTGDRPITLWPAFSENINAASDEMFEEIKSSKSKVEIKSSYLSQQLKLERAKWKQGKLDATPLKPNERLPPPSKHKRIIVNQEITKPTLRRKTGFSQLVKQTIHADDSYKGQISPKQKAHIASLQTLQKAIYEGKMEQVASAPAISRDTDPIHAPPRPLKSPFLDPSASQLSRPRTRRSSRSHESSRERPKNGKRTSTSTKLASYVGTSADILDETRREITGKFRPPFEHLHCPSLSSSRRVSIASSSSSFYCQGELEELPYSHPPKPKVDIPLTTNEERRLSGQGTSPFNDFGPRFCRRCQKGGVAGVRGLCDRCENDYAKLKRPKDAFDEYDNIYQVSGFGDEKEEIKPTPPLKDIHSLALPSYSHKNECTPSLSPKSPSNTPPSILPSSQPPPTPHAASSLSLRPKPQSRAQVVLGNANVESKPAFFIHQQPIRKPSHTSHKAEIEQLWDSDSDSDQALADCERAFLAKEEYYGEGGGEKAKQELRKWADVYAIGKTNVSLEAVGGNSKSDARGRRSKSRDSQYYGFYEDVLRDYGEEPMGASKKERMC